MIKWHIPDLNTLEKKLNTDISDGLSAREARNRFEKQKKRLNGRAKSLFVSKKQGTLRSFFVFISSPFTILLLIISLMTAIFGRGLLGSLVFVLTLAAAVYSGIVNVRADRRLDSMKEYASPMVRVKRGGNVFYTDGRNLVIGDVILLSAGDLLPCDARIIKCDALFVDEILPKGDALMRRRVMKRTDAKYTEDDVVDAPDALNMLYAGSAIAEGSAIALVVAIGENAYLAKHVSDGALAGKDTESQAIKGLRPIIGKISFILAVSLLVLSLVGFFTLKGKEEFICYFTMLLSAIFLITPEFLAFTGREVFSSYITRLSKAKSAKRKKDNSAAIRSVKALDKLTEITDLVLFGTAGIYEGGFKIGEAFVADKPVKTLELCDDDSETLISHVYTYLKALKISNVENDLVSDGLADALNAHVKASGFDINGATLAIKSLYYATDMRSGYGYACAETESSIYRVALTFDENILKLCRFKRVGSELIPFTDSDIKRIKDLGRDSSLTNLKKLFCVSEMDGNKILEGAITVYQSIDPEIASVVRDMSAFGINTTVILPREDDEAVRLVTSGRFKSIFAGKAAFASEFKENNRDITEGIGEYGTYVGFTVPEYSRLITEMRERGSRIASFGINGELNEVMAKTDVVATCDVIRYSSEKHREAIYERLPAEGRDTNLRASQQTRLLSRIIVRRAYSGGGGVYSLFKAVRMSRSAYVSLSQAVLLFALLSVNLLTFSAMSVLTGNILLDPLQVVSLASVFAILSATVFSDSEHKLDALSSKRDYTAYPSKILHSQLHALISRASVAFITALTVKILDAFGVFGNDAAYTLPIYICLLLTMCFEVLLISFKHTKKGEGRSYTWIKVIIAYAVLLSVCAVTTQQPFASEYYKNGFGSYEYLIIPGYLVLYGIALLVSHIINKKNEAA